MKGERHRLSPLSLVYFSFNFDFLENNQSETRIAFGGHVC
jgi:hypothetical protein